MSRPVRDAGEHLVDLHVSWVASRVQRFVGTPTLEDIAQTARREALFQFGPGTMILAHVHDGDDWSEHEMVVWLPPEGEFGR